MKIFKEVLIEMAIMSAVCITGFIGAVLLTNLLDCLDLTLFTVTMVLWPTVALLLYNLATRSTPSIFILVGLWATMPVPFFLYWEHSSFVLFLITGIAGSITMQYVCEWYRLTKHSG